MKYDYIFVCWQIFIVLGKMPQEKPNKKHKDKEDLQWEVGGVALSVSGEHFRLIC